MKNLDYQEYIKELGKMRMQLEQKTHMKGISNQIFFVNVGSNEEIKIGVNIAGTGDVHGEYARCFAYCIEVAADMAEQCKYNGYAIK